MKIRGKTMTPIPAGTPCLVVHWPCCNEGVGMMFMCAATTEWPNGPATCAYCGSVIDPEPLIVHGVKGMGMRLPRSWVQPMRS